MTSIVFALALKLLQTTGLYLALALSIILIFCGFYYVNKGTRLRLVTWGILGAIILSSTIFGIIMLSIESIGNSILN